MEGFDWSSLIILIAPVFVAGLKQLLPSIPKVLLPLVAILFGAGAELIMSYSGVIEAASPLFGAIAGAAGVGLRELTDQTKKLVSP
jgi:hypothetical protein